jgi:MIP family channel proteins
MQDTGRAALAELIGTFLLVFVAASAATLSSAGVLDLTGLGLATGLAYGVVIATTLRLSGGHANPAVSIALWVSGRVSAGRLAWYVSAQLIGAVLAALLVRFVFPGAAFDTAAGGVTALSSQIAPGKGIVLEAVGTFFLVFAFFALLEDARHELGRGGAALLVGLVLAAATMAFSPLTGAALNPARWFGTAVAAGTFDNWFVWLVGPIAGGIVASVSYSLVFLDQEPAPTA